MYEFWTNPYTVCSDSRFCCKRSGRTHRGSYHSRLGIDQGAGCGRIGLAERFDQRHLGVLLGQEHRSLRSDQGLRSLIHRRGNVRLGRILRNQTLRGIIPTLLATALEKSVGNPTLINWRKAASAWILSTLACVWLSMAS